MFNRKRIAKLQQEILDLKYKMHFSCAYCDYQYGPCRTTKKDMFDEVREHIEQCDKHPLSEVIKERDEAYVEIKKLERILIDIWLIQSDDGVESLCIEGIPLDKIHEALE